MIVGHSAKYGSYTMMDLKANRVIDIQLVQVNNYTMKTFCYVNYYILCIDLKYLFVFAEQ